MAVPEILVAQRISAIHKRLQRAERVKEFLKGFQSAEDRILATLMGNDTPIAKTTETIALPAQTQNMSHKAQQVRDWLMKHAPTYEEKPSARVDDESGWAFIGERFEMSADDITQPSSLEQPFLLSVTEISSIHYPQADVWFAVAGDDFSKYNLRLKFFDKADQHRERIVQEYISDDKSFEEMPEDDAIIVGDLIERTIAHLTEQTITKPIDT